MIRRNPLLPPVIFLLLVFVSSCRSTGLVFKSIDVNGMVYDFSNRPVTHYEIVLGRNYRGSTDINGRFTVPKVPAGTYRISGNKTGYESYIDEVIVKERGQIIYIRIPSQNQLLNMVEDSLVINNFAIAEEMTERAYQIDKNNTETLFYCATVAFRQRQFDRAVTLLEEAINLGSKDLYIEKFLTILKELKNEEETR